MIWTSICPDWRTCPAQCLAVHEVEVARVYGMDKRNDKHCLKSACPRSHGGNSACRQEARQGVLLNRATYGVVMKQLNEQEVSMVSGGNSSSDQAEIAAFFEAQRKLREEEFARLARNAMN